MAGRDRGRPAADPAERRAGAGRALRPLDGHLVQRRACRCATAAPGPARSGVRDGRRRQRLQARGGGRGRWCSKRRPTTGCVPTASASSAGRAALTQGGRSMSFNRFAVAVLLAAACIGGALACGPNFPWQLLRQSRPHGVRPRRAQLRFRGIAPGVPQPAACRKPSSAGRRGRPGSRDQRTRGGAIRRLAQSRSRRRCRRIGGEARGGARPRTMARLPWRRAPGCPWRSPPTSPAPSNSSADRLEAALRYFEAIDQPAAGTAPDPGGCRRLHAGRVYQQLGQLDPARAAFQAARRYAEAGAPDPMGLARRKPRRGSAARPGGSGVHRYALAGSGE